MGRERNLQWRLHSRWDFDDAERRSMPIYADALALERNVSRVVWLKKEEALGTEKVLCKYGMGTFTTVQGRSMGRICQVRRKRLSGEGTFNPRHP